MNNLRRIVLNLVVVSIVFAGGMCAGINYAKKTTFIESTSVKDGTLETEDFDLIFETWRNIKDNYIEDSEIDLGRMVYGSVKGFVSALGDPYTVFLDPEETAAFRDNLNAELQGIGAEVSIEDGNLIVVSPLRESPSEKAGLRPRDIILEIDGKSSSEMTLIEAVMAIRGKKGTSVILTIFREKEPEPFDVTIVRDDIKVESVTWEMKNNDIFYISINQFSDDTKKEFSSAISELLLKKPKGIILDLRYNGGGYLDMAVEIISELIVGKKEAVQIKWRDPSKNQIMYTSGNARVSDLPLVVLINEGSASASEIVAGAVQDYHRGKLFGSQSFGKGSVQEIDTLSDGSSLRLTIAKWLTPKGRSISDVGIAPDSLIEITDADIENKKDPQLEAALEYLKQF